MDIAIKTSLLPENNKSGERPASKGVTPLNFEGRILSEDIRTTIVQIANLIRTTGIVQLDL